MKKLTLFCLSILISLITIGCSAKLDTSSRIYKLNTSSEQEYASSMEIAYNNLLEQERIEFLAYLLIVIEGQSATVRSRNIWSLSYENAIEAYKYYKTDRGEAFHVLNGLTAKDVIYKGRVIRRKYIEDTLSYTQKELEKQENILKKYDYIVAEQNKIEIEIINPVKTVESNKVGRKGLIGSFVIPVMIKNNSSLIIHGLYGNQIKIRDQKYVHVLGQGWPHLNDFVANDGTKPFLEKNNEPYSSSGIAAGQTVHGTVTTHVLSLYKELIYPPTQKYTASVTYHGWGRFAFVFKEGVNYDEYVNAIKIVRNLKESEQRLSAELLNLSK